MAFYRYPSPVELSYIAEDTPETSPFVNQFVIEGVGDITVSDLQAAVHRVAEFMPEIRLVMRGVLKWRYWDDGGPLPRVYAVDASHWDGQSSDNAPVLGAPMNVRKGPLCEVVLLEGEPLRILFRTHHACTDGLGTLYLMESVFKVLRGEPVEPPNSRKTDWDVVQQEGHVEKQVKLGNAKPIFRNFSAPTARGYHWKRMRIPGSPSGITGKVMSVLADMANNGDDGRFLIRVPSDLRRYLPKDEFTASNCAAAMDIEPEDVRGHKKMQHLLIQNMRNRQDLALLQPSFRWALRLPFFILRPKEKARLRMLARNRFVYSVMLTNLGEISPEKYCTSTFEFTGGFGVPIPLRAPMTVGFCYFNKMLWLSIGMPSAVGTREDLDRVSDEIVQRLSAL